jgi:hypothetical protein
MGEVDELKYLLINLNVPLSMVPYLDEGIGRVRGHAWSNDPESYASGTLLPVGAPLLDRSKVMALTK